MRHLFLILILSSSFWSCHESLPKNPPNIILFFVDDMGWQDTSVPFWNKTTPSNQKFHTPNMEKLASQGVKFTNAYATPVCSPSRISLMTGMNAARHRVTNWTLRKNEMKGAELNHPDLNFPFWNTNGLALSDTSDNAVYATPLPQILKDNGYVTIHAGKAHLGAIGMPSADPLNLGFEVNIAGHAAGAPGSYLGTENFGNVEGKEDRPWNVPGLEKYHGENVFLTEALTLEALSAMEKPIQDGQPFFLYMSLYGVHTPIMSNEKYFQKYLDQRLDTIESRYATMVESMDKSLGDLMIHLEENQLDQNTVILFMADNGGLSAVARGGEKHMHNLPLKSGKGSIYEGGIREPMIVKWPGVFEPGTTSEDQIIIEDFFPSILDIAGISEYNPVQIVDGKSFAEKSEKGAEKEKKLVWHYPNQWGPKGPGIGAYSAIIKGDWKLIYSLETTSKELYNLQDDIGETQNVKDEYPDKVNELSTDLAEYLRLRKAQMPTYKSNGKMVPWPDDYFEIL